MKRLIAVLTLLSFLNIQFGYSGVQFTHPNHIDSEEIVTDQNGEVRSVLQMTPLGERVSHAGDFFPYSFTGKEGDDAIESFYLGGRYYDAALARFLSPDSVIDFSLPKDLDPYSYAWNNPLVVTDPSGNEESIFNVWDKGVNGILSLNYSHFEKTYNKYLVGEVSEAELRQKTRNFYSELFQYHGRTLKDLEDVGRWEDFVEGTMPVVDPLLREELYVAAVKQRDQIQRDIKHPPNANEKAVLWGFVAFGLGILGFIYFGPFKFAGGFASGIFGFALTRHREKEHQVELPLVRQKLDEMIQYYSPSSMKPTNLEKPPEPEIEKPQEDQEQVKPTY